MSMQTSRSTTSAETKNSCAKPQSSTTSTSCTSKSATYSSRRIRLWTSTRITTQDGKQPAGLELQTYKICNQENESLFRQLSELKTLKFNRERKIQDMLTLNGGGGESDEIRERIEAKLQHLYNSVSEKAVRISELVQRLDKLQDDNNKLKIELTSTTTRFDERLRQRVQCESMMPESYNKDSDFTHNLNFMKTARYTSRRS